MPILIFLGWILGIALGFVLSIAVAASIGATIPAVLQAIASPFTFLGSLLPSFVTVLIASLLLIIVYVFAYRMATLAIAPSVFSLSLTSAASLPLSSPVSASSAITIPAANGEFFARGLSIGLTAAVNLVTWSIISAQGIWVGLYGFLAVSLCIIIPVARNRVYQGFLGWAGWILPLSYLATFVGLLLFVANVLYSLFSGVAIGLRVDWTTGVVESAGGLSAITGFSGGFSLGCFTFVTSLTPGSFTASTISSHETGHSLNTFAMGGIVLWINAVDENVFPVRMNLAYGELLAEGHSRAMPGTPSNDFAYRLWF